jgi:hypothetical protein
MGVMVDLSDKEVKVGKTKLSKYTYKRIVDNFIFVHPRQIELAPVTRQLTRPLRAETMQGKRIALSTSENIPAGTTFELTITTLSKALDDLLVKCLDYGQLKGLGQWRNASYGRFKWELIAA